MKTGPKPTPQAMRTPPAGPPDLLTTPPEPPAKFDTKSAKLWWEVSQILIDRRQLARGDLPTLANYIRLGMMIREATISADMRLVDKLIGSQTRLAREFSLTPSARASFPSPPVDDLADDLEAFKSDTGDEPQPWVESRRLADTD